MDDEDKPALDSDQVLGWLRQVCPPETPGQLWIGSQSSGWAGKRFDPRAPGSVVAEVVRRQRDPGVYMRVGTIRHDAPQHGRGSAEDTAALFGFWVDLDIKGLGHKHDPDRHGGLDLAPDADTAWKFIDHLPEPTVRHSSGGGLYAWWLPTNGPWVIEDNLEVYQDLSVRLQYSVAAKAREMGYHYGTEVSDLARILRLPGTVNRKVTGHPTQSHIIDGSGPRYYLADLDDAFEPLQQPSAPTIIDVAAAPSGTVRNHPVTSGRFTPLPKPFQLQPGEIGPLDAYAEKHDLVRLLIDDGWTYSHVDRAGRTHLARPGKPVRDGVSGNVLVDLGRQVLYVFSGSAGLPVNRGLSAGQWYAHRYCGGSETAAAKELFAAGYGTRATSANAHIAASAGDLSDVISNIPPEFSPKLSVGSDTEFSSKILTETPAGSDSDFSGKFSPKLSVGSDTEFSSRFSPKVADTSDSDFSGKFSPKLSVGSDTEFSSKILTETPVGSDAGYRPEVRREIGAGDHTQFSPKSSPEPFRPRRRITPLPLTLTSEVSDSLPTGDFWSRRAVFAWVKRVADARMVAPYAVLGALLAQVVVRVGPHVQLPPTVGSWASLNLFVGLVGASGTGKDTANDVAEEIIHGGQSVIHIPTHELGSGQGVAATYTVQTKEGPVQFNDSALFVSSEITAVGALSSMNGSTLMTTILKMYNAGKLGEQYADQFKRRPVGKHAYRAAIVAGVQPANSGVLLADEASGTPQRWLWLPATTTGATLAAMDALPPLPEQWPTVWTDYEAWRPSGEQSDGEVTRKGRVVIELPEVAIRTVRQTRVDRLNNLPAALDSHALLTRLKVAAIVALLDGRTIVSDDDWDISGHLMSVSDETRGKCVAELTEQKQKTALAKGRAEAIQSMAAKELQEQADLRRVCRRVLELLPGDGATLLRKDLTPRITARLRPVLDDALEHLLAAGQIRTETTEGQYAGHRYGLTIGQG